MITEEHTIYRCDLKDCPAEQVEERHTGSPDGWVTAYIPVKRSVAFYGNPSDERVRHYCCIAHAAAGLGTYSELPDLVEAAGLVS